MLQSRCGTEFLTFGFSVWASLRGKMGLDLFEMMKGIPWGNPPPWMPVDSVKISLGPLIDVYPL